MEKRGKRGEGGEKRKGQWRVKVKGQVTGVWEGKDQEREMIRGEERVKEETG